MKPLALLTLALFTTLALAQQPDAGKATKKGKGKAKTTSAELANRMPTWFPEFDHTPDIVYKTVGDQKLQLDLLTPKGLKSEAAPLLVYIHGGGWGGGDRYRCSRPDISGVFKRCAAAGILCATIEYRLNSPKATAFDSATDCKDALRFLVKNAKQYRIDPERIGTIGGSAGGHLSLVTALGDPKDFPGDPALAGFDPKSLRCEVASSNQGLRRGMIARSSRSSHGTLASLPDARCRTPTRRREKGTRASCPSLGLCVVRGCRGTGAKDERLSRGRRGA